VVSVFIVAYNRVEWLDRVLLSVAALDYPNHETVVVDDALPERDWLQ
jgi:glycosyltransferase involved in cell wall biosynthesis